MLCCVLLLCIVVGTHVIGSSFTRLLPVTVKFLYVVLVSAILFVLWFVFVFLGCCEWLLVHVSVQLIASKDCL